MKLIMVKIFLVTMVIVDDSRDADADDDYDSCVGDN